MLVKGLDPTVIVCRCAGSDRFEAETWQPVLDELRRQGRVALVTDDLCGLAARRDKRLLEVFERHNRVVVLACEPRAVTALLAWAGIEPRSVQVLRMRAAGAAGQLREAVGSEAGDERGLEHAWDDAWTPWFPVIEQDRCKACRRCVDFCLFDVYEVNEDGRVDVIRPERCKNKCPACARICPTAAIMFPKCEEDVINGAVIDPAQTPDASRMQVDLDKTLGGDIYAILAERGRMKRRLIKENALKAEEERARCARESREADRKAEGDPS